MNIIEVIDACAGKLISCGKIDSFKGIVQDSRKCYKGCAYVALKGENNDGHDFIKSAIENGASTIIVEKKVVYPDVNIILVKDTLKALGDLARYQRIKSKAIVVGVTGSVGKTTTKDMIYSVVSTKYKVLKTAGNYNNHIGLPLTILRYVDEDVMILEMGMNHLGEIHYLSEIAKPNIAVITNVGTAHIGQLGSRENILKAKMEIVDALDKNGTLIINNDDDMLSKISLNNYEIATVGINTKSNLMAFDIKLNGSSTNFTLNYNNKDCNVSIPVSGTHFIYNALLAIEVGLKLNISIRDCLKGISSFSLTENRADIIQLKNNIRVYDGTYNANLESMRASLEVMKINAGRKIAVLGDMLELGKYEEEMHRKLADYIIENDIDLTVLTGSACKYTYDVLKNKNKKVYYFKNNLEIIEYLLNELHENDVLLIKASNGMHFNEIIKKLKEIFY